MNDIFDSGSFQLYTNIRFYRVDDLEILLIPKFVPLLFIVKSKTQSEKTIKVGHFDGICFIQGITNPHLFETKQYLKIKNFCPKYYHETVLFFQIVKPLADTSNELF